MNKKLLRPAGNINDIAGRLTSCAAMLHVIHAGLDDAGDLCDALYGACDFLESIIKDLRADIDHAEKQAEKEVGKG